MEFEYAFLRKEKGNDLRNLKSASLEKIVPKYETYHNATVFPLKKFDNDTMAFGRGGVVDEQGKYIPLSGNTEDIIYGAYEISEPQFEDKKVLFCGCFIKQWGHFLIDSISRLWYLFSVENDFDEIVFYSRRNATELFGNYRRFFELLGIIDKVKIISVPIKYREIVIPEIGYARRKYYSDEYLAIFSRLAENVKPKNEWEIADKLFLSRAKLKGTNEFGLEAFDHFFYKNGYKVIYPEKCSLDELVYCIQNANHVASMDGSLAHNMLFAKDNVKSVIIERRNANNHVQIDIAKAKRFDLICVDANLPIFPLDASGPYIMYYNKYMDDFAKTNGLIAPDKKYTTERYRKKLLKDYLKSYWRVNGYQFVMPVWYENKMSQIFEAYADSKEYYGEYLSGAKPVFIIDLFRLRTIKCIVLRCMNKIRRNRNR